MMDSSTRCCKNHFDRSVAWFKAPIFALLLWLCSGLAPSVGWAQESNPTPEVQLSLERAEDGLYLNAHLQLSLSELIEDALHKGIPMFFVAEAEVLRERWYWSDLQVSSAVRYFRLSYQPLTRRWRLSVAPAPFSNSGLGVTLGQSYEELEDVLSAMQRISRWKIAQADAVDVHAPFTVNFRFRLDTSQLPRPFQFGAVGQSGWSLLIARSQRFEMEPRK